MLPFPSMVEWDADELAGNYFSRLAGENGVSSKYAFLRWLGFSRNLCHGQIMDIVNLSPTWIALAEKLEISLDDMIRHLSTKPYWACFYTQRQVPSTQLEALSELPASLETILSVAHPRLELRICPICLLQDHSSPAGVTIVRRSHQLPGSLVCHMHGVRLIHRCPGCNRVLVPRADFVRVPTRCESCDYELTRHTNLPLIRMSPIYRLAVFEHDCLYSTYDPRPAGEVVALIRRICRERKTTVEEVVLKKFGPFLNDWRRSTAAPVPSRVFLHQETMPTLCACLVALGFTHDSVQQAISHFETDSNAWEKAPYKIESVSQARKIVLAMSRAGERVCWYRLKVKSRYLFWFLVLNDRAWLERRLAPRRRELKIPAVSEDREAILTGCSEHQRRQAYARAYYRDREWMLAAVSGRRSSGQRRQITVARDAALRDSIMKAMAAWFAKPGRPIKFTLERAAASVGVIQSRILNLISRNPQGQGRLYESTTHYRLRVLSWLMREKAQQGVPVTPGQLYKQAGVAPSWGMRHFWAASIVYLFGPPGTGDP